LSASAAAQKIRQVVLVVGLARMPDLVHGRRWQVRRIRRLRKVQFGLRISITSCISAGTIRARVSLLTPGKASDQFYAFIGSERFKESSRQIFEGELDTEELVDPGWNQW